MGLNKRKWKKEVGKNNVKEEKNRKKWTVKKENRNRIEEEKEDADKAAFKHPQLMEEIYRVFRVTTLALTKLRVNLWAMYCLK